MAVVQISRIQIRRGKINSGTGMPQLASGEMAWAVDAQELYIGNGAVSEGSPAVGNTKILTANDLTSQGNILNLVQYIYKANDTTITTGPDANNPISRSLQDRIDENATAFDFGVIGDGITDDTITIQRAIDQLFLNPTTHAHAETDSGIIARRVLEFPAGVYKITGTLYIPSQANIRGAGIDKTVFSFETTTNNIPAIRFVNDTSTVGEPSTISSTQTENQPKNIHITGITIHTTSGKNTGMVLDCVRDSLFENIKFIGDWAGAMFAGSTAIRMNAKSDIVTCENNIFNNIRFHKFTYAVFAKQDIKANQFHSCYATLCYQGFVLGLGADGDGTGLPGHGSTGEMFGSREMTIADSVFENIKKHAVYIELGTHNSLRGNTYRNVGCNGSGNTVAVVPQVFFRDFGNTSIGDRSDRPQDLANEHPLSVYVPEVGGHGVYTPHLYLQAPIGYQLDPVQAFRLPVSANGEGAPEGSVVYSINYFYKSSTNNFTRRGTMTISADIDNGKIQLSDEFDFAGTDPGGNLQLLLDFQAVFHDSSDVLYTGAPGQSIANIIVKYKNNYSADGGNFNYSYTASF
jgi:hypothetical protein